MITIPTVCDETIFIVKLEKENVIIEFFSIGISKHKMKELQLGIFSIKIHTWRLSIKTTCSEKGN